VDPHGLPLPENAYRETILARIDDLGATARESTAFRSQRNPGLRIVVARIGIVISAS